MPDGNWKIFSESNQLARQLASDIADHLTNALCSNKRAGLAVSGGTTPLKLFHDLAKIDLDWSRIIITLIDERQVGPENDRSNAKLVRDHLLVDQAKSAHFVPLFLPEDQNGNIKQAAENCLNAIEFSPDVAILGMGQDGHTASLFPGGDHLAEALDTKQQQSLFEMQAQGALEKRITFGLSAILKFSMIALHIEGEAKRQILSNCLKSLPPPTSDKPVSYIFAHKPDTPIYWAP